MTLTCERNTQRIEIGHEALYKSRHQCNGGAFIITTTLLSICLFVAVLSAALLFLVFIRRQYGHGTKENFLALFKKQ